MSVELAITNINDYHSFHINANPSTKKMVEFNEKKNDDTQRRLLDKMISIKKHWAYLLRYTRLKRYGNRKTFTFVISVHSSGLKIVAFCYNCMCNVFCVQYALTHQQLRMGLNFRLAKITTTKPIRATHNDYVGDMRLSIVKMMGGEEKVWFAIHNNSATFKYTKT